MLDPNGRSAGSRGIEGRGGLGIGGVRVSDAGKAALAADQSCPNRAGAPMMRLDSGAGHLPVGFAHRLG